MFSHVSGALIFVLFLDGCILTEKSLASEKRGLETEIFRNFFSLVLQGERVLPERRADDPRFSGHFEVMKHYKNRGFGVRGRKNRTPGDRRPLNLKVFSVKVLQKEGKFTTKLLAARQFISLIRAPWVSAPSLGFRTGKIQIPFFSKSLHASNYYLEDRNLLK